MRTSGTPYAISAIVVPSLLHLSLVRPLLVLRILRVCVLLTHPPAALVWRLPIAVLACLLLPVPTLTPTPYSRRVALSQWPLICFHGRTTTIS